MTRTRRVGYVQTTVCLWQGARVRAIRAVAGTQPGDRDRSIAMDLAIFPHRLVADLIADHHEIVNTLLPSLSTAIWDLELAYGADDEELGRVRGDCDELQTDIAIHLGEEAEFLMPLMHRLASGERLPVEVLDRVGEVIAALKRRHDDFDGEISALRNRLLEASLPPEAEQDRADIVDRLDALLGRLRRHDKEELETLFPAALERVHAQLIARDCEEDLQLGWE